MKIRKLKGDQIDVSSSEKFTDLTQEYDIRFYMGLINQDLFRTMFEFLNLEASTMAYWDGNKKTLSEVVPFDPNWKICYQVQKLILKC